MRFFGTILVFLFGLLVSVTSCKRDIDDIDETPIDPEMLLGGWEFTGEVKVKINAPVMKNIAENLTEDFMKGVASRRKFYFTKKRAYCVWSIDTDNEKTKQSEYTCNDYKLEFAETNRYFYNCYVPMFYVKNQTESSMTFYLLKDEIVNILKSDKSIPSGIIEKIEDGICEMPLRRYHNKFWDEIDGYEVQEDETQEDEAQENETQE